MDLAALRDVWTMFRREHRCSVDRMLCDPILRQEFLKAAQPYARDTTEQEVLWTVVNLRKSKSLKPAT